MLPCPEAENTLTCFGLERRININQLTLKNIISHALDRRAAQECVPESVEIE